MVKKKLKNKGLKHLSLVPVSEMPKQYQKDYGLGGTRFVVVSQNSRLKAGKEKHDNCHVKNEFKKDRLERLVVKWLERLSRKYDIATAEKEQYLHLLLKLILPPIVKNGFEGKLRILRALNAVSPDGSLATPTTNYSVKEKQAVLNSLILRSGLNES